MGVFFRRLVALFRRKRLDRDLDDELAFHLAMRQEEQIRKGTVGSLARVKEEARDAWMFACLEGVLQDGAHAIRSFRRRPAFAIGAVIVLALGLGVNTAVFSIVRPLLLQELPFAGADELVWISPSREDGRSVGMFPAAVFEELKRRTASFSQLSAYFAPFEFAPFTLTGQGDAEALTGTMVAPNFFELLGVQPLGRYFSSSDASPFGFGGTAVVISHGLWERRFAGDPSLVGKDLSFSFGPATVVGILPPDFDFGAVFAPGVKVDLFLPLPSVDAMAVWGSALSIVGRLTPHGSAEDAQAELDALIPQLRRDHPQWGPVTALVTDLNGHVNGRLRRGIGFLWGSVAAVLLVACTNFSILLLERATARQREIALRIALGASRGRVVRQMLTEAILLALTGAVAGMPIAYTLVRFVQNTALAVPLIDRMAVDSGALLFAAGTALIAGLASVALPAFRIAPHQPDRIVGDHPRGSTAPGADSSFRSLLVICEVALTCVLLIAAGLLARSFLQVINVELGFRPTQAHRVRLNLAELLSLEHTARRVAVLDEATARVRALPGVQAAGITDALPLERNRGWAAGDPNQVYPAGRQPAAFVYVTGPGYLGALGIPLVAGRDFSAYDTADRPAVIVNERLARRLWPEQNPLGRAFATSWPGTYTVVGVVADVRQSRLEEPSSVFQMYLPYTQVPVAAVDMIIRSSLPASSLAPAVRTALSSIHPDLMASALLPIDDLVERAVSPRLFLMRLVTGFALLALVLSCVGIWSVVSYGVTHRFHEIGIRVALGASRRDVTRHAMGSTLRATVIGLTIGTIAALTTTRLIAALLYKTSPIEPVVFVAVPIVMANVALLASYLPARRAANLDPLVTLRFE